MAPPAFLIPIPLSTPSPLRRHTSRLFPKLCATTTTTDSTTPENTTPENPSPSYILAPDEVGVRFINTPSGKDVIAAAKLGDPLLQVGDSVGISIPRQCQSGLCGSCTCDVLDPEAEDGRQTIRACQAGVAIPQGSMEMVVDVERMKSWRRTKDPMARFENLDTDYVAGAAPRARGWMREVECAECESTGDIECYACDGMGVEEGWDCMLCGGTGKLRCGDCQGKGVRQLKR